MSERSEHPDFEHRPVMVTEVVDALQGAPPGTVLDATVGGGGHAEAILEARPDLSVVGLDLDDLAFAASEWRLARFGERVTLHRAHFADLGSCLDGRTVEGLSGFLFDLGVSSPQLDCAERGFSYRHHGPLDMRMDRRQELTAAQVVNEAEERELAGILARNADERFAHRIARAVVARRPINNTLELAEIVRSAIPAAVRRTGGHPAKRTFQAIRIEVNRELDRLSGAVDEAIDRLVPGGRGAVHSYHSGEDRLVKDRFSHATTGGCTCPARLPCACGAQPTAMARRRSVRPSTVEVEANPRAKSARLRVVERL